MKQWATGAALLFATALAAPASAQQGDTAHFAVGSVEYTMPIPAGYCLPTTAVDVERMRFGASLDHDNVTTLSLVACGPRADTSDYYLLKTPNQLVEVPLTLETMFAQLGPQFDAAVSAADPDIEKQMSDALSTRNNKKTDIDVAARPRGHDDLCGYVTGVVQASGADTRAISYVTCLTVARGRLITINLYAGGSDPAIATGLMPRARAMAASLGAGRRP